MAQRRALRVRPKQELSSMTTGQKVILWSSLISGVLMGLFPPWKHTTDFAFAGFFDKSERPAGYTFIATPPAPAPNGHWNDRLRMVGVGVTIDVKRLAVQYVVLIVGGVGLFLLLGET